MNDSVQRLEAPRILGQLGDDAGRLIASFEVVAHCDSTNAGLLAMAPPEPGQIRVLLTENQAAGRGRRGREWRSPPGSGLCLSLATKFAADDGKIGALSLVLGVASRRALDELGVSGVGLKWPNDLVAGGKLGGILVEMRGGGAEGLHVVAGIGVNVDLPPSFIEEMSEQDVDVVDLKSLCPALPDRNCIAAALIRHWVKALSRFRLDGCRSFVGEWTEADVCRGRRAMLVSDLETQHGTCCGIDEQGRLVFDVDGAIRRVIVGELSLRLPAAACGRRDRAG